jgi:hypothetical protein
VENEERKDVAAPDLAAKYVGGPAANALRLRAWLR